jgi:GNAT superfamily N-acetyltransferase
MPLNFDQPVIRALVPEDMKQVLAVQSGAYIHELIEGEATFLAKLALFPSGCWGVPDGTNLAGYVFSHPWRSDELVPLDHALTTLPDTPDSYYIHDLAVAPSHRGRRVSALLLERVFSVAKQCGLSRFSLVAVQNSETFWEHWGFRTVARVPYGAGLTASHMIKEPDAGRA